jgi:hypothetical protein
MNILNGSLYAIYLYKYNSFSADVCIWLCIPFGWKTEFVSGNCVREARELIPWTMKTFDHRG